MSCPRCDGIDFLSGECMTCGCAIFNDGTYSDSTVSCSLNFHEVSPVIGAFIEFEFGRKEDSLAKKVSVIPQGRVKKLISIFNDR